MNCCGASSGSNETAAGTSALMLTATGGACAATGTSRSALGGAVPSRGVISADRNGISARLGGVRATQVIEPFTEGGVGEREGVRELGGPRWHARARVR